MDVQALVQQWNDAQVAAADAELLHQDFEAAQEHLRRTTEIEKQLAEAGYCVKE
ncbi:hypothetical protein [Denitromonas sp.]|jgi:hypothetical protein|uniref:hypothetical protein n=1 Tax=Denitromonas sp. TaxID=2734609 RepID=UPI002AFFE2F4|nr:hypothetical protein [Denitromonas sp.]